MMQKGERNITERKRKPANKKRKIHKGKESTVLKGIETDSDAKANWN